MNHLSHSPHSRVVNLRSCDHRRRTPLRPRRRHDRRRTSLRGGDDMIVGTLLAAADPTRPLLTWYDDTTGERTELSGATLGNWVAKTANLLVDGVGAGPGDRA